MRDTSPPQATGLCILVFPKVPSLLKSHRREGFAFCDKLPLVVCRGSDIEREVDLDGP